MLKLWNDQRVRLGLGIFLFSLLLRLPFLSYPDQVIFDEVHFGKFVSSYCCTNQHFFDIHPPAGKLLIAGAVRLFSNYDGTKKFEKISEPYNNVSPWPFRVVPATFGGLIPLMVFLLLLSLGASNSGAFLGGLLTSLDNGLITQSRVISLDSQLIFFELLAVCAMFWCIKAEGRGKRILLGGLSGGAAAMAVGCKLTGLIAVSLPMLLWLWFCGKESLKSNFKLILVPVWFFIVGTIVYLALWKIHFSLLTEPGFGDKYYRLSGDFFYDFTRFHYVMYERNATLTKTHSYSSSWVTWPFMTRGIFYWSGGGKMTYFLGNPIVWVGSTVVGLVALGVWVLRRCSNINIANAESTAKPMIIFALIGYLNAFLPYTTVKRDLFLYHYLPPLVFLIITIVLWFETIGLVRNNTLMKQRKVYFGLIALAFIGFLALAPLTYGWDTAGYNKLLFSIFKSWR